MYNQSKKLLICFCIIFSTCYGSPTVTISQGVLEGVDLTSYGGRTISSFMGIPYAQPPLGDLRFKAPQPASSWNGKYTAANETIRCIQIREGAVVGEEDCLYLNVYTPQLPEDNTRLLPVMVYVFGGGFAKGSASLNVYGPHYLLDHDVVLVAMNYRLGPLGFMTTGDEEAPGNFGLKDQILALRWVQENIAAFGGDAKRVTIFGNSSGSITINFLTLSELAKGLFHQFILQSGTALNALGYRERSKAALITTELAESFDCSTDNSSIMVQCLREQDAGELVSWTTTINGLTFVPTDEPESDEAVLTDSPKNLLEQGKMHDLPWMTGVTQDEGLVYTSPYYFDEDQWDDILENLRENVDAVTELLDVDNATQYTNAIMDYYFNDLSADKNVILQNYTKFLGDAYFVYPAVNLLQAQISIATQSAHMYLLDYLGTYSITYEITGNATSLGTCHGDDIYHLFTRTDSLYVPADTYPTETDLNMMKRMTAFWTSFATNGVPTVPRVLDTEQWLGYDENNRYLHVGNKTGLSLLMESTLFPERMNFWIELMGLLNIVRD